MNKCSILVIAEKTSCEFYHSSFNGMVKDFYPVNNSITSLPEYKYSLVLLDCGFNVKKGLRLLRELKKIMSDVPIIFLTDVSSESTTIEAFRSGARDYFKKPFNIKDIKDTITYIQKIKYTSGEKRIQAINRRKNSGKRTVLKFHSDIPLNILRSICYMEENLSDSENISLEAVSKEANMSKYHFCREFKKTTGMSPMQLMTYIKINRAKELLRKVDYNISSVAVDSGFQNLGSFYKSFKKHIGMSPTSYRNSIKKI